MTIYIVVKKGTEQYQAAFHLKWEAELWIQERYGEDFYMILSDTLN